MSHALSNPITPEADDAYRRALAALGESKIPFLVGGGYAFLVHTGIARMTKDFDIFVRPGDVQRVLDTLAALGFETEITYSHWLAKAYCGTDFVDVIFNSGNGRCPVDERWFEHATRAEVMGFDLLICPAEEALWQKAFIMERERFDGADVAHLLHAQGAGLDWPRLLERFGPDWQLLLAHLTLFEYIYPGESDAVPTWVLDELARRKQAAAEPPRDPQRVCRGTLLSRTQYQVDVRERNYRDLRLQPQGSLTAAQIERWDTDGGAVHGGDPLCNGAAL